MAIAVIGGLTTSTLLTLVIVPAVFTLFDDIERWMAPKAGKLLAEPTGSAAGRAVAASSLGRGRRCGRAAMPRPPAALIQSLEARGSQCSVSNPGCAAARRSNVGRMSIEVLYPLEKEPGTGDGSAVIVAPGVLWLRMPLYTALPWINVWAIADAGRLVDRRHGTSIR